MGMTMYDRHCESHNLVPYLVFSPVGLGRAPFSPKQPGQVEQGEADVEKADLIAKDIGDHQLADEAARSEQGSVGAVEVVGGSTSWEVVKAADVAP